MNQHFSNQLVPFELTLFDSLQKLNATEDLVVAFSGGLDSKSLLHALVQLKKHQLINHLSAIHVNHGLQSIADQWLIQCQQDCEDYQIPIFTTKLLLTDSKNIEANARHGRYDFFKSVVKPAQTLIMAHHQDDQAETLLFRLLRGCGIDGAAAMPISRPLGKGRLVRPLLNVTRKAILDYAKQNKLSWIDDPTNLSADYSRNFLRHHILKKIETKWPSYVTTFTRFSQLASEQNQLLIEVAKEDLSRVESKQNQLDIQQFKMLSTARQKNLLHYWGKKQLILAPSFAEISEVLNQIESADKKSIKIRFSSGCLRSFEQRLILCNSQEPMPIAEPMIWKNIDMPLDLNNGIRLVANRTNENGLRLPLLDEKVIIKARAGGEKCLPDYREKSTELKKIFQELNIPPWQRTWLPIIYFNQRIAAIPGVFVDKHFLTKEGEQALQISLEHQADSP